MLPTSQARQGTRQQQRSGPNHHLQGPSHRAAHLGKSACKNGSHSKTSQGLSLSRGSVTSSRRAHHYPILSPGIGFPGWTVSNGTMVLVLSEDGRKGRTQEAVTRLLCQLPPAEGGSLQMGSVRGKAFTPTRKGQSPPRAENGRAFSFQGLRLRSHRRAGSRQPEHETTTGTPLDLGLLL